MLTNAKLRGGQLPDSLQVAAEGQRLAGTGGGSPGLGLRGPAACARGRGGGGVVASAAASPQDNGPKYYM